MLVSLGNQAGSVEQKVWYSSPPFPPLTTSCESDWLMAEIGMEEAGAQHVSNQVDMKAAEPT